MAVHTQDTRVRGSYVDGDGGGGGGENRRGVRSPPRGCSPREFFPPRGPETGARGEWPMG